MTQPPSPSALRQAREWLDRAERDLLAARNGLSSTPPLPEMTAYHAQQAAEKAFKAFLTLRNVPFRRTHDLLELLQQCEALDAAFRRFVASAQTLDPYATRFRYPGGPLEPPVSEAEAALRLAEEVVDFVRARL
jgi:HEPN domain-containing protein